MRKKSILFNFAAGILLVSFLHSCNPTVEICNCVTDPQKATKPREQDYRLIAPADFQLFVSSVQNPPDFSWSSLINTGFDHFLFRIYTVSAKKEGDSVIRLVPAFEASLKENHIAWPKQIEWKGDSTNKERWYFWEVAVVDKNGEILYKANRRYFTIRYVVPYPFPTGDPIVKCKEYKANGDVCYEVTEHWASVNSIPLMFTSFHVTYPVSNNVTVQFSTPPPAIINPPGGPFSFTYTFCVPPGTSQIMSKLQYNNYPAVSHDFDLPPCMCTKCDSWTINITNQILPFVNSTTENDYCLIWAKLTVNPDPAGIENIIKVVAEIVDFEEICTLNKQCDTCNTKNSQHGVFVPYWYGSAYCSNWLEGTGWLDPYGTLDYNRQQVWSSSGPAGVDMRTGKWAWLTIGLPKYSDLRNCCCDKYYVCIRYTFTSYNASTDKCTTCSKTDCYTIDRTKNITESNIVQPPSGKFFKSFRSAEVKVSPGQEFLNSLRTK